jgi:hypothetical protein
MVTGHGKLRSYLYRFGLKNNPKCPYEEEEQTTNHLVFNCKILCKQRNEMIKQIKYTCGNWPMTNETLVNDYLQIFVKFVKSIDFQTCNDTLLQKIDRSQRMCVNIFSCKFRSQNITIDIIMNLHYSL